MKKPLIAAVVTTATLLISAPKEAWGTPETSRNPGLCLALRGNGFRIGAHFGSMARMTEVAGLPDVVIGSSSGSISSFLLDSVAMNPLLAASGDKRNLEASLLIKTIPEFMSVLMEESAILKARELISDPQAKTELSGLKSKLSAFDKADFLGKIFLALKTVIQEKTVRDLISIYRSPYFKDVINPEIIAYWKKTNQIKGQAAAEIDPRKKAELSAIADYRNKQLADALNAADKFDVRQDDNLLFRSGILNHRGFVRIWDRMASLYAGYNMTMDHDFLMKDFLRKCSGPSKNRTFEQLAEAEPSCRPLFRKLAKSYLRHYNFVLGGPDFPNCSGHPVEDATSCARYRMNDKLGDSLNAFVITSAFVGDTSSRYTEHFKKFDLTTDPHFGSQFKLRLADFKIGIFGDVPSISRARQRLLSPFQDRSGRTFDFSRDFKAQRVWPLGKTTWLEAIAASTAEPGPGRPQTRTDALGQPTLTAGGWPDPVPVHFLKGLDCETSVPIVTAIKPGNNFGEQVMQKIFSDMTGLDQLTDEDIAFGNNDHSSDWGRWRNPRNPKGSDRMSFQASEAVYCTQWDEHIGRILDTRWIRICTA